MPENDQTRWIGIRPTNPAENIPVIIEGGALAAAVAPLPGCDPFPVTESAPLTTIQVEPLAVGTEFKTLTEKRAPAIADLQAPETMVRVATTTVAAAGNNTVTLYTVPAGKLFQMQCNIGMANSATPTNISLSIDRAGVDYPFYNVVYGAAWKIVTDTTPLLLNEGEKVVHTWAICGVGINLWDKLMGYLIDKY